ncbi:MAG: hypothetical protein ABIP39_13680 [Polyangiaceae bacterium]
MTTNVAEDAEAGPFSLVVRRQSIGEIAKAGRLSALEFSVGVARGWAKRDLAEWLGGSYRSLVDRESPLRDGPESSPASSARGVSAALAEATLRAVMVDARSQVLDFFIEPPFVKRELANAFLDAGFVRAAGSYDAPGFLAVDLPKMRLCERVLSLLVADFLTHPAHYEDGAVSWALLRADLRNQRADL